jgi:hypothetical protein
VCACIYLWQGSDTSTPHSGGARTTYSWQGSSSWVPHGGTDPGSFVSFISALEPTLRPLFHFPDVSDAFWRAPDALKAMEDRYPGWDQSGEYAKAVAAAGASGGGGGSSKL